MAMSTLPSLFGRDGQSLGSLFREIERTFEDFSKRMPMGTFGTEFIGPEVDIVETKDAVEVTAELPGCDEKDIEVVVSQDMLTLRGEKKTERREEDKDKNWHLTERSYGAFSRTISLPFEPDTSKVEAKFDKGVLRVRLPKPAEVVKKEKKIEIKKA
jgi:HSP20 family protein